MPWSTAPFWTPRMSCVASTRRRSSHCCQRVGLNVRVWAKSPQVLSCMSACVCACVYVWSTQHTYTHACIYALMHQCIHIKATVVCICTYIYKHTYRTHNTDMTCARIYITYIAWIHIIHTYMHNIHTCMPFIHALHTYITHIHAYLHRHTYVHTHAYTHRHDWSFFFLDARY